MPKLHFTSSNRSATNGFTLVEIMIVVVIIGILAAIAIPAFANVRFSSQQARLVSDLRVFSGAFQTYCLETGDWPEDAMHGVIPSQMIEAGYLSNVNWSQPTPVGGLYDWDRGVFGVTAAISLYNPRQSDEDFLRFSQRYDDGSLDNGRFRKIENRFLWVLEEEI